VAGRDITEGRGSSVSGIGRAVAVDIGLNTGNIWQNTGNSYDCAIAGIPFLTAINDQRPYERATAPFRKQQFDSQRDPGEQSLSTWWLRNQSSFHAGEGVNFYDPLSNPYSTTLASNSYRFKNSLGVEVFDTQGQVSILRRPSKTQNTTTAASITPVVVSGNDRILIQDNGALKLTDGTTSAMTTLSAGVATTIYASATDGLNAYYIDAANIVKVALTGGSTSTVRNVSSVTSAVMGYVKQRLVVGINNKLYEVPITTGGGALPAPVYTHPNTSWVWTSITEGGGAIYASGYSGTDSTIYKFTLDNTGAMPVLTSAITAAIVPSGETITNIYVHLMTYIAIGTNKGVRIGTIDNNTGNISYGPLIIHTNNPVRGFSAHDSYIYAGTAFTAADEGQNYPGVYKIDLSNEIDNLRFAYSTYIYAEDLTSGTVIDVCHLGRKDQLAFIVSTDLTSIVATADAGLYVQSATELYTNGWLETGAIRYNTLEPKNFKRILGRGDFTFGSMFIQSRDLSSNLFDIVSYDAAVGAPEATLSQPVGAQEALGLRFVLYRDAADNSKGAIFKGYQLKAVPATPRSRLITIPLMNYDTETDKYNSTIGYEGRAIERLAALETAEGTGDVVIWQDFRTGELSQCLIEEVKFTDITPPDKRLTGFGGIISLTIRTV
jgi:hypothetical protein